MVYSLGIKSKNGKLSKQLSKLYEDIGRILAVIDMLKYVCTGAENPVPREVNRLLRNLGYDSREHYSYIINGLKYNVDIAVFDDDGDLMLFIEFKHYSSNQRGSIIRHLLDDSSNSKSKKQYKTCRSDTLKVRDVPMITVGLYSTIRNQNDDLEALIECEQTFPKGCVNVKSYYSKTRITSDSEEYQNNKFFTLVKGWLDSFIGENSPLLADPIISDIKKFEPTILPRSRNGKKPTVYGYVHYVILLWK